MFLAISGLTSWSLLETGYQLSVPRVWKLDEITSVPEWTGTLKYLRNNTNFGEDTVICTGSSWDQAANVGRDLLAGRAGRNSTRRLRMLLPMQFRDVVIATQRQLPLPAITDPWDLQGSEARRFGTESPVSLPGGSGPQLTTPLEPKWVSQGWRREARTLEAKFDRGILALETSSTRPPTFGRSRHR